MTEGIRTFAIAAVAMAAGFSYLSLRTAAIPISSPERLIAELRFAQMGALLLTLVAGAYLGFAASHDTVPGSGLDVALAVGFTVVAGYTLTCDPRQALTILALAFGAHAVVDIAHRPGVLPEDMAPRWYTVGCATWNVLLGAACYFPILRRP